MRQARTRLFCANSKIFLALALQSEATQRDSVDKAVDEIIVRQRTMSSGSVGRCTAIYDYDANLEDELTIRVGDIIHVHEKQADGWWLGETAGRVGIFPATYVRPDSTEGDLAERSVQ